MRLPAGCRVPDLAVQQGPRSAAPGPSVTEIERPSRCMCRPRHGRPCAASPYGRNAVSVPRVGRPGCRRTAAADRRQSCSPAGRTGTEVGQGRGTLASGPLSCAVHGSSTGAASSIVCNAWSGADPGRRAAAPGCRRARWPGRGRAGVVHLQHDLAAAATRCRCPERRRSPPPGAQAASQGAESGRSRTHRRALPSCRSRSSHDPASLRHGLGGRDLPGSTRTGWRGARSPAGRDDLGAGDEGVLARCGSTRKQR
jgi:hypothetical protein